MEKNPFEGMPGAEVNMGPEGEKSGAEKDALREKTLEKLREGTKTGQFVSELSLELIDELDRALNKEDLLLTHINEDDPDLLKLVKDWAEEEDSEVREGKLKEVVLKAKELS